MQQRRNILIISPLSQLPPVQEIIVAQHVMRLLVVFSLLTVKPRQTASNRFDARIFVCRNSVTAIRVTLDAPDDFRIWEIVRGLTAFAPPGRRTELCGGV